MMTPGPSGKNQKCLHYVGCFQFFLKDNTKKKIIFVKEILKVINEGILDKNGRLRKLDKTDYDNIWYTDERIVSTASSLIVNDCMLSIKSYSISVSRICQGWNPKRHSPSPNLSINSGSGKWNFSVIENNWYILMQYTA